MSACRIALPGFVRAVDGVDRTGVNAAYAARVAEAGAIPLVLSPVIGADRAADALEGCGGLLLSGGADIDPARYGAEPSPALGSVEPERDAFEFALLAAAQARRLPVLAICRGMQLVNVAEGGTLWQDLDTERPGPVRHRQKEPRNTASHGIRLEAGTRLASVVGALALRTNSTHHQAVREVGEALRAIGWAEDGLVEALEYRDGGAWMVGVQWHPEELASPDADRALFREFVAAAERGRA
jgi:putative glutamine amidotransferase